MSGAEAALLGVGILCNAMQIITFCRDALQVYRNVSDGRSPDPRLEDYLRNAKASFDEMNQRALNASQIRPLNSDQQQIVDVGRQVHDCVDELQRKFAELHVDDASKRGVRGKLAASRKSAATLWRGKELEGIEKSIQRHEHLLHGLFLHRICNQAQAAEISSIRLFHQLDTTLQQIITQLAEGCTRVSDLTSQASLETRDRVVEEHTTTRSVIDQRLTATENTLHSSISDSINQVLQDLNRRDQSRDFKEQYEQLLESLRFPEMNSRMNHISENYPGTFSWIFDAHKSFLTCWRSKMSNYAHPAEKNMLFAPFSEAHPDKSGLTSADRDSLLRLVVWKAGGVFLWVALVLDSLNRAIRMGIVNIDELEERLNQIPTDLKKVFIDMWGRAGDDGELRSYRVTASRYFNLVIKAKMIERLERKRGKVFFRHSMRSLPILATALCDKPVASIFSTDSDVRAEELQARCERVEAELTVVCRGLLEVINSEKPDLVGDKRLCDYNSRKVEFIHRSAFDFLNETEIGRESLSACCWSRTEQASRLLAGHLINARFVCPKPSRKTYSIGKKIYAEDNFVMEHQLHVALYITWTQFQDEVSVQSSMLQTIRDWQLSGLFCDHAYWNRPQGFKIPSNPKALEFLEQAIQTTCGEAPIPYVTELLDHYSMVLLIDSIHVILRGLESSTNGYPGTKMPSRLIEYTLNRLTCKTSDEGGYVSLDAIKDAIRLLHSWYITYCLDFVSTSYPAADTYEEMYEDVNVDLLRRFSLALPSADDWQHPLKLEFHHIDRGFGSFSVSQSKCLYLPPHDYALIIANFYTAYRLLDDLLLDRLQKTLGIQAPEGVGFRFEIVLVGDLHVNYKPASKYHSQIRDFLQNALYERVEEKAKGWAKFLQDISDGLEFVDPKHNMEDCIHELGKSDLDLIPPWSTHWVVGESI